MKLPVRISTTLRQRRDRALWWPLVWWHWYRWARLHGEPVWRSIRFARDGTHLWVWRMAPAPQTLALWANQRFGDLS